MTLVSFINGYQQPVIISDRAISDRGKLHKVVLPTTNAVADVPTPVVEFQVKSVILQDILCVAFAGSVLAIEKLLEHIYDFFLHREINSNTLAELFADIGPDPGCTVLFALGGPGIGADQLMIKRFGRWEEDDSQEDLYLLSAGTGAAIWTPRVFKKASLLVNDKHDPRFGRQRALLAAIMFHSEEWKTADNLLNGWGGGFDIVYYEDGRFHPYNQVAYAFWRVDITDLSTLRPVSVVHNSYLYGNVLVRNFSGAIKDFHVISGFGQKLPPLPPSYDCSSNDIVTCVFIDHAGEYRDDLVMLYHNPAPEHGISFNARRANDGVMEYFFDDVYKAYIISALKQHLDIT